MNSVPVPEPLLPEPTFYAAPDAAARQRLVDTHRPTLERAVETLRARTHWSPYPEDPAAYGTDAEAEGERAFHALLDKPFPLDQPGRDGTVGPLPAEGGEVSPTASVWASATRTAIPRRCSPARRPRPTSGGRPERSSGRRSAWRSWPGSTPGPPSSPRPPCTLADTGP